MSVLDAEQLIDPNRAIAIPLNDADRAMADRFAAQQPTDEKVEQVYRNTLAVLTTQRYLDRLGVVSETATADSWHPLSRVLEDVADVRVPGFGGTLECRVVRAGDRTCYIPETAHADRLGYVVVQLDQPYQMGYLIGFVETVSVCHLPLSYLQPLTGLIELLLETEESAIAPVINLRQWLNRVFEPAWDPPTDLLNAMGHTLLQTATLTRQGASREDALRYRLEQLYRQQSGDAASDSKALFPAGLSDQSALLHLMKTTKNDNVRWQCADLLWEINPNHPDCPVITAKDLGLYLEGRDLALAVGLLPKANNTLLILARLYPFAPRPFTASPSTAEPFAENNSTRRHYLPAGLTLSGLDENDQPFFEIAARGQDNYIQFKFTAEVGERFTLKVSLAAAEFSEMFVV